MITLLLLFSLLMMGAVSAASDTNDTLSSDVSDEPVTHTNIDKTNSNNNNANVNEYRICY